MTCQFAQWHDDKIGECLYPLDVARSAIKPHLPVCVDVTRIYAAKISHNDGRECPVWIDRTRRHSIGGFT